MRNRLRYTEAVRNADYYITNFRWDSVKPPAESEFKSVVIDGVRLSASYRIRNPK
jgi:hypothetical protein